MGNICIGGLIAWGIIVLISMAVIYVAYRRAPVRNDWN